METLNMDNTSMVSDLNTTISTASGPSPLKLATNIVLTTTLIIIMLGMGCAIELDQLRKHLRHPVGAAIGMLAQFIVLPLVTFGFAHALRLDPLAALGMLVMGCCPGGSTSNMFTLWADGEVSLSLTMTSLATLLSLGMMPFNLWLYSRKWTDDSLVVPYTSILVSLVMTVVPAAVGIVVRWRAPRLASIVVKAGSVCGGLAVLLTMTLMSLLYPFMYAASWRIYVGAFFLPFVGFFFGFIVARLCRLDNTRARTVALETGIQNFPLCMTLISLSFPRSVLPRLSLFPLLYGVFVLTNSCIFVIGYRLSVKYLCRSALEGETNEDFKKIPYDEDHQRIEIDDEKQEQ